MRWILLLLLFPLLAHAQWLEFEACGLKTADYIRSDGSRALQETQPAPTVGPYWIWVPAINYVKGATEKAKPEEGPRCTLLVIGAQSVLVIGTLQQVMTKIRQHQ